MIKALARPLTALLSVLLAAGALAVLTTALVAGSARPAAADAFLVAANPADGAVLTTTPHEVMLTFSEPVEVAVDGFAVVGPDGFRVDPGVVHRPGPAVVTVRLPGLQVDTRPGIYRVSWRVISADSHPVGGSYAFSIGSRPGAAAGAFDGRADPVVSAAYGVAGFVALTGLIVLVGAVAFCLYGRPGGAPAAGANPALRRLVVTAWLAAVAGTLAALALRGPYAAGTGPGRLLDGGLLGQTLDTRYGTSLAVRLLVLGALPVVILRFASARDARSRRGVGAYLVAGAVGAALAWTMVRHTTTGPAAVTSGVAHALAAAVWLGGLPAVLLALRGARPGPAAAEPPPAPAEVSGAGGAAVATARATAATAESATEPMIVAGRFTRVTAGCVAVLVVTGGYHAWRDVGGPAELLTTAYGRLLTIKIVLVGALVAVALRVRPWSRRPGRMIAAGSAAALVLALTAALVEVTPAAQAQADRPATRSASFAAGGGTGVLEVRLPRTVRGVDRADMTVRVPRGRPGDVTALQGAWTQPGLGVGPLPVRFTRTGAGRYRLEWPPLPVDGLWRLAVTVRTPAQEQTTVRLSVRVR